MREKDTVKWKNDMKEVFDITKPFAKLLSVQQKLEKLMMPQSLRTHNRADVVRAEPHGPSGCESGFPCKILKGIFEQKCFAESSKKMNTEKLSVFCEKRPMSLKPLSTNNEWEYIETILDSGATVTVIPPHVGRSYDVVPSAASRAGVKYEVANGEEIPNLGEKLMPVMTREGSMRGLRAQVADVSKALQSVRALVKAGHVVIFGDGDEGQCHYVYNKFSGETNEVTDDGINYLMGMYIIPPDDPSFGRPAQ